MKNWKLALIVATIFTFVIAGCGKDGNQGTQNNGEQNQQGAKKDVSIKMFNYKVEIAEALNKLVEEYEKETGVKVEVETHGGGEDYGALLKAELASGSEPEIFNNGGYIGLIPYMDRATDLTDEAWSKDLIESSKNPMMVDGKLYGMPMNVEGYGIIYNKSLFEQAGITEEPKTLSQLKEAVEKLNAEGITPFMATNEWWSLGMHLVNVGLANQPDPQKFIEDVKAGNTTFQDNEIFNQWLDLVDLIFNNAQKEKMTSDYASQIANFSAGKAAMMLQGNWTQADIDKIEPSLQLGVLPAPINDNEGSVLIGVPSNYIVNSKSEHPEEAKNFLNWLVTSETGKTFVSKEFKFIPALTSIEATENDIGQIAVAIQEKSPTAVGWYWDLFPDGVTQGFGAAMQEYLGAQISREQLLEKLDKAVQDILKQ
ncbi:Multiple sugar-binding protein precursor [compost metagenome]